MKRYLFCSITRLEAERVTASPASVPGQSVLGGVERGEPPAVIELEIFSGKHRSEVCELQGKYTCSYMELLRNRAKQLDQRNRAQLQVHEVANLLTRSTASAAGAYFIGELGGPSRFRKVAALARYVGVVARIRQSGQLFEF